MSRCDCDLEQTDCCGWWVCNDAVCGTFPTLRCEHGMLVHTDDRDCLSTCSECPTI